jgi:peptidoglycan/LPS O-acetylase OafA/YrhL
MEVASRHRYDFIDALRGYAILGVISVHVSQNIPHLPSPALALASSGMYGVQLFFVVSALTLMLSWRARNDGAVPFCIRRIFRIAPMFWAAIPFYLMIDGFGPRHWAPGGISWPHILATAPFVHGWHPETINSVVPGGWSIAVEMSFYMMFPILATVLHSWGRVVIALTVSVLVARYLNPIAEHFYASIVIPDQPPRLANEFVYFWIFNQIPVFLIGFCVFFALRRFQLPKPVTQAGLVASVLLLLALPFVYAPGPMHIKYALCFGALAFCLGAGAGRWLVNNAVCQLGKISYSAYLWHFSVITGLNAALNWAGPWKLAVEASSPGTASLAFTILLALALSATAGLSILTYRFVEQPMISAGNRIIRRRSPTDGVGRAPAAPALMN